MRPKSSPYGYAFRRKSPKTDFENIIRLKIEAKNIIKLKIGAKNIIRLKIGAKNIIKLKIGAKNIIKILKIAKISFLPISSKRVFKSKNDPDQK